MKKLSLFLAIIMATLLVSCSSEEDVSVTDPTGTATDYSTAWKNQMSGKSIYFSGVESTTVNFFYEYLVAWGVTYNFDSASSTSTATYSCDNDTLTFTITGSAISMYSAYDNAYYTGTF